MDFSELESDTKKYMLLADDGIIKLLCAFIIACKLPVPPPWVFIVSSSSGGKTKLIQLLEGVPGYLEVDDLTANTLLSGAKRSDKSPSFLHRLEPNGFLVFKDFTTILSKYKEQMTAIIGQFRMVYDGKFVKETGTGDSVQFNPEKAPGLLAGVTTKIYTTSSSWGEMGERFVMYHMQQPDNREMGAWIIKNRRDEKKIEAALKEKFNKFLGNIPLPKNAEDLPEMDAETSNDLIQIAFLTVMSRSPVERNQYDRKKRIELTHDHEMIGRFLKQLMSLAYAMMLLNGGALSNKDKKILYKIGLDSIPAQRLTVMKALTQSRLGGDLNQLADTLKYPYETVEIWVNDLVALGIVKSSMQFTGSKKVFIYSINQEYMEIISKFEGIEPEAVALPASSEELQEAAQEPIPPANVQSMSWETLIP